MKTERKPAKSASLEKAKHYTNSSPHKNIENTAMENTETQENFNFYTTQNMLGALMKNKTKNEKKGTRTRGSNPGGRTRL
ncbi:hypothetical protein KEJ24_08085 [Candidatus Bathyarchaeota archaeon]|nr:hypothetical protein [Candidatus Bathyarchaeota archaeon]